MEKVNNYTYCKGKIVISTNVIIIGQTWCYYVFVTESKGSALMDSLTIVKYDTVFNKGLPRRQRTSQDDLISQKTWTATSYHVKKESESG